MRSTYRPFHLIVFLSLVAGAAAQAPIYTQDFEAYEDGTETNAAWTIDTPEDSDYFAVYDNGGNNQWWGDDTDGAATWTSEAIDVSNYSNLSLAIFLGESGNQESQDFIRVNYVLDGSTVQLVQLSEDFSTSSQSGLSIPNGSSVQIQVVMDNNNNSESHYFDDIVLTGELACSPISVGASNASVSLSASGQVTVTASTVSASVISGDCFTVSSYEVSKTSASAGFGSSVSFDCSETGSQNIWVRATDGSNVSSAAPAAVTISDLSVLQAVGQDVTVVLDNEGSGTLTAAEVNNGSQGNCLSSLSISQTSFDCSDVGANSVNLTISDGSNSDVTTVTVTVVGHCSCEGNTVDALGVCGGDCPADADNDGICDNVDDCVEALSWSMSTSGLTGGEFEDFTFESTSDVTLEELNITMSASGAGSDNWASDLLVAVIDPSGNAAEWGGYNATFGSGYQDAGNWPEAWDSEADAGSPFVAAVDLSAADLSGAGTWTVRLANGWMETDDSMSYDLDIVQCDTNLGCTDPTACNYDNTAVVDDGSCIDPHPELGCCNYEGSLDAVLSGGASSSAFTFEATGTPVSLGLILDWTDLQPSTDDPDANDLLLTITDPSGLCVSFGGTDLTADGCTSLGSGSDWPSDWNTSSASYQQYTDTLSLVGSGLQGNGEWSVAITNGLTESGPVSYGLQWGFEGLCFLSDEAEGCTDEDACNYDAAAAVDDGSCLMPDPLSGCICEQTGSQVLTAFSTDTVGTPETFL
ncbi:MAG: hypothetical protein L7S67_07710, partial [Flavobacteriales bacterium]|nr:hypothetical protein [Flavobacteriales bacterium]